MSIQIVITEKEINDTPNDFELGKKIRTKLFNELKKFESEKNDTYDVCVICGKVTPYKYSHHIDMRIGYVEGVGQTCPNPNECQLN